MLIGIFHQQWLNYRPFCTLLWILFFLGSFPRENSQWMNLRIVIDAICEALLNYMHLYNMVNNTFPNDTVNDVIKDMIVII